MTKNKTEETHISKEVRIDRREQTRTAGMIHSIIPPHMLKEISKKGNQKQKDMAMRTLMMSEKMRGRREAFAEVYVAASTGAKCIRVYDAKNLQNLPGEEVQDPGNSSDTAIKEAFDGADATYNMDFDVYERNSIDDRGMCIMSTVHFDVNYDNAFWDGRQMVYGDGDGELFNRFTIAVDDNGGVHINSGIPNHAFYLTAMEIGGNAWDKAGKIWYIALRDMLRYNANFQSAADKTFQVAGVLFGSGSKEQLAVKNGWAGVGITLKGRK